MKTRHSMRLSVPFSTASARQSCGTRPETSHEASQDMQKKEYSVDKAATESPYADQYPSDEHEHEKPDGLSPRCGKAAGRA